MRLKFAGAPVWLNGLSLDGRYKLDHTVAHWGATDASGSEHTLDGTTFPAEVLAASLFTCDASILLELTAHEVLLTCTVHRALLSIRATSRTQDSGLQ